MHTSCATCTSVRNWRVGAYPCHPSPDGAWIVLSTRLAIPAQGPLIQVCHPHALQGYSRQDIPRNSQHWFCPTHGCHPMASPPSLPFVQSPLCESYLWACGPLRILRRKEQTMMAFPGTMVRLTILLVLSISLKSFRPSYWDNFPAFKCRARNSRWRCDCDRYAP